MPHIVIANRLADGLVVFLGEGGRWVGEPRGFAIAVVDRAA